MLKNKSKTILLTVSILSITILLVSTIGGWIYIERQRAVQRDKEFQKELQQKKELTEYEQKQANERAEKDRNCYNNPPSNNIGSNEDVWAYYRSSC
ncbi:MAG TPA: hypothetical protein VD947_01000 [Patescibacteria group bacterium]|nr:hypothetical protein [Patescibacteria group bacterium]